MCSGKGGRRLFARQASKASKWKSARSFLLPQSEVGSLGEAEAEVSQRRQHQRKLGDEVLQVPLHEAGVEEVAAAAVQTWVRSVAVMTLRRRRVNGNHLLHIRN